MNKFVPVVIGVVLSARLGWYAYQKYELLQSEKEYFKYMAEPKAQVFLWNRTDLDAQVELRYKNGNVVDFRLGKNGGTAADYPAGDLKIVAKFSDHSSASFENLTLNRGVRVHFEIHKDSIEPKNR